jgi:hypothetical protein
MFPSRPRPAESYQCSFGICYTCQKPRTDPYATRNRTYHLMDQIDLPVHPFATQFYITIPEAYLFFTKNCHFREFCAVQYDLHFPPDKPNHQGAFHYQLQRYLWGLDKIHESFYLPTILPVFISSEAVLLRRVTGGKTIELGSGAAYPGNDPLRPGLYRDIVICVIYHVDYYLRFRLVFACHDNLSYDMS